MEESVQFFKSVIKIREVYLWLCQLYYNQPVHDLVTYLYDQCDQIL